MPAKKQAETYVARHTGLLDGNVMIKRGITHASADDPLYKKHKDMFEPVSNRNRPFIEQATASPGEERGEDSESEEKES